LTNPSDFTAAEYNDQNQANLTRESDMEKERFLETGRNSFFGDFLYDHIGSYIHGNYWQEV
jgi:hypothetical protein